MNAQKASVIIAIALGMIGGSSFVHAQDARQEMNHIDLTSGNDRSNPVIATWVDEIAKVNARWAQNGGRALSPGQVAPSDILWHEFNLGGRSVVASIFLGTGCDAGPNDKDSTQGWAVCPARITITGDGGVKTLQTQACFQYFPLSDGAAPPAGNRSYASLDRTGSVVTFTATQDGQIVPSCTRSVRIPR